MHRRRLSKHVRSAASWGSAHACAVVSIVPLCAASSAQTCPRRLSAPHVYRPSVCDGGPHACLAHVST
eukprot:13333888-Alexandrium_andersonii.AAC.2